MSTNIFKTVATTKNSSNKGNNNSRFSSLKDELNEQPIVIQKKRDEKAHAKKQIAGKKPKLTVGELRKLIEL